MKTLHSDISEVCKRADIGLWDAYARSVGSQPFGSGAGRLVFPQYRDKGLRVSEQEARFAFIEALSQGPLRYSVEAPTSKLYSFSGKKSRSAQTDLQMHSVCERGICNIEFKASAQKKQVYEDIQKLRREPLWGLWFHLLDGINKCTISKFLSVMAEQIDRVQNDFGGDIESPVLTLHVCVLRHGFSIQQDVPFPPSGAINVAELNKRLHVDLHVSRYELKEVRDLNGWTLHQRPVATAR